MSKADATAKRWRHRVAFQANLYVDNGELYDRIEAIDGRIRSLHRNRKRAYSDDMKASCGVVVSLGFDGEPEFRYGLLRKEDEATYEHSTG